MCVEIQRDFDSKWLVRIDGTVRLPNGDPMPTIPGKGMRQVVEQLYKDKSAGNNILFHEQPEMIPDKGKELTVVEVLRALIYRKRPSSKIEYHSCENSSTKSSTYCSH